MLRWEFGLVYRQSIISGLESWGGVLEWSGVKFGVKFGGDFGGEFRVRFGVIFFLEDSWSQWVVPLSRKS